jgi:hypothetical protein
MYGEVDLLYKKVHKFQIMYWKLMPTHMDQFSFLEWQLCEFAMLAEFYRSGN